MIEALKFPKKLLASWPEQCVVDRFKFAVDGTNEVDLNQVADEPVGEVEDTGCAFKGIAIVVTIGLHGGMPKDSVSHVENRDRPE